MEKVGIIVITLLLLSVYTCAEIAQANDLDTVVIDGPWTSLPAGAGPDLAFDSDWDALTLQSDLTNFEFVLSPDPNKAMSAQVILTLGTWNGRIYLGYGDIGLNLGPVDIVNYDPLSGKLTREMLNVPEEGLGLWHASETGRFYVAGKDTKEIWPFGNFFVNDGFGWQKRRTIYNGGHVNEVVEFKGRLYIRKVVDQPPPVDYPYILVSDNQGASWSYERVDPGPLDLSSPLYGVYISDIETVTHQILNGFDREVEYFYAIISFRKPGGEEVQRLYRFDGQNWEHVRIDTPSGELHPDKILTVFKGQILILGSAAQTMVYALDGQIQKEVPFLAKRRWYLGPGLGELIEYPERDGWLYFIAGDPTPESKVNPVRYIIYRTQDLLNWETVGTFKPVPGVMACSLGVAHGRLYVGAGNMVLRYEPDYVESRQCYVYTIHNSTLQWDVNIPDGAQMSLKVRTMNMSPSHPPSGPFVGPDGTENTAFTSSGQFLHPQHNGNDVLQVAIYKTPNNDGEYPHIRSVTLNSPDGSVSLAVDEGAGLYTAVNSTDPNGAEYVSQVFALQEPIAGGNLFYDGATPGQTSLRFQVRSGSTETQLRDHSFIGPDGTSNTFYQFNDQALWSGHDGDTYIQYRAILASSEPTLAPFLRKVVLITRTNKLDHFNIQLEGPNTWTAGQLNPMTVEARSADDSLVPIEGRVSLSAIAVDSGESVPIQPKEISLVNGIGTFNALLQWAIPTQICVQLADIKSCSTFINILPGEAHSISVMSSLREPIPNWSPVGQAGQPFTLSLRVLDRYHNPVTGYTGAVRCERWSWQSKGQLIPTYIFQPSDNGFHEFTSGITIDEIGEWNIVCYDETTPKIAGTLTVNIQ